MAITLYIETTLPSAYVSTRTDVASIYRRELTREWWDAQIGRYDAAISEAVLGELLAGTWPGQRDALALVESLPSLDFDETALAVAHRYVREKVMPADLFGDAAHLAIASVNELDYLVTWNIRHLANPNKLRHLAVVNRRLGLPTPAIVTPELLWLEEPR